MSQEIIKRILSSIIIVGIAWIGTSFYFNWLDSRLDRSIAKDDLEGELWSVHSGGFSNINKLNRGRCEKSINLSHSFGNGF